MNIVLTVGVYDIVHHGHVKYLERARALGDALFVGVIDDELVKQAKGRLPINPLNERMAVVQALRSVSHALPVHDFDYVALCQYVNADVWAMSEEHADKERFRLAAEWMLDHGKLAIALPRTDGISTSDIVGRIRQMEAESQC